MRTEEAILQATLRLLAERGVQGTSLDLLAEAVGVAKSSILWHFGSKEELLLRVTERVFDEVSRGPARAILALPTLEARSAATWDFFRATLRPRLLRDERQLMRPGLQVMDRVAVHRDRLRLLELLDVVRA